MRSRRRVQRGRGLRLQATTALCALLVAASASVAQQRSGPRAGSVSGSVVDARTGAAVAGASVVLQAESRGLLAGDVTGRLVDAARTVLSDRDGQYRFEELPPGRYRLHVIRPGYRSTAVSVELRGSSDSRVWVGLEVEPITLEPVRVRDHTPAPYRRARYVALETSGGRRVIRTPVPEPGPPLPVDARELVHADVVEAVTLGESDLFRALQRMAGVSTRDDYAAELWMRGAPWDQTRVYFDGVPLFDPLHGAGAFSGVSTNAIGAAWLYPGARSAALGEGAAGVVDLRTRRGRGDGGLNGVADLSLVSTGVSLDETVLDGRGAWMLSGRRTYLDWLTLAVEKIGGGEDVEIPYAFWDVTGRFDLKLDDRRAIEVSGLFERDRVSGDIRDVLIDNTAAWGNAAARATYEAPLLGWRSRHTVGGSRYLSEVHEDGRAGTPLADEAQDPTLVRGPKFDPHTDPPARSTLDYVFVRGALDRGDAGHRWQLGYELARQSTGYEGPPPRSYPGVEARGRTSSGADLTLGSLWVEHRGRIADGLSVEAGLRLEVGDSVANGGPLRTAPRLAVRYEPRPGLAFSAGVSRVFQYAQAIGLVGPRFGAFYASRVWLLSGPDVPAVRSDIATLGGEMLLGDRWQLTASGYLRRATGVAVTDPEPGEFVDRPLFVPAENLARGAEVSLRRLVGRWTATLGYTYGVSELEAGRWSYPAGQDRRHAVDVTAMVRLGSALRLGGAFTAATGAPFTRRFGGVLVGDTATDVTPRIEAPHAQRTPGYASLDLMLDWTGAIGSSEVGVYLQLRNALGRDNAITYRGSRDPCDAGPCGPGAGVTDEFETGIPRLPVVGFRVRF